MSDELSEERKKVEPKAGVYEQGHPGQEIPEQQGVYIPLLMKFLDEPTTDPKIKSTVQNLIMNVNQTSHQCQLLMNGLAVILSHKYAPLNVRQGDLDRLPAGWSITITPVDDKHYQIGFTAPDRSKGGIILPHRN